MSTDLTADQINLSDSGSWGRPFEERDTAFRVLRDQRPVAFFHEPPPGLPTPIVHPWLAPMMTNQRKSCHLAAGHLLADRG